MRVYLLAGLFLGLIVLNGCKGEQKSSSDFVLPPSDFSQKINEYPASPVIDVRNPAEFSKAHLQHAVNVDVNGGQFEEKIASLDKSKPVFLYCLSGARSAAAAEQMRSIGFKEVYELEGGLMKWRAANLPEVRNSFSLPSAAASGMSKAEFEKKITSDKLVLVDFYADWCAPCKKMKPYLDEIAGEMKDKVELVRINADDQPQLCKELDVVSLPTLLLYKNKTLTWENRGYLEKSDIVGHLN